MQLPFRVLSSASGTVAKIPAIGAAKLSASAAQSGEIGSLMCLFPHQISNFQYIYRTWNMGPNLVFFPSGSIIFVWLQRGGVLSVCEEDRGCFPEEPEM